MTSKNSNDTPPPKKSGHPFIAGCLIGIIIGVLVGWLSRPPSSFPVDDLKAAMEERFLETKDKTRINLADFAEELAQKLRGSEEKR